MPLASMKMADARKTTDGVWAINICRDWKNPREWSSPIGGHAQSGARLTFTSTILWSRPTAAHRSFP